MSKNAKVTRAGLSSVLVGVDFSESSGLAFDRACDVASLNEAGMLIVHVLPAAPMSIHGVQPVLAAPDLSGRIRELAEQKLVELQELAAARGVAARTILTVGSPGPALIETAEGAVHFVEGGLAVLCLEAEEDCGRLVGAEAAAAHAS